VARPQVEVTSDHKAPTPARVDQVLKVVQDLSRRVVAVAAGLTFLIDGDPIDRSDGRPALPIHKYVGDNGPSRPSGFEGSPTKNAADLGHWYKLDTIACG
jgi:hypothetical protein